MNKELKINVRLHHGTNLTLALNLEKILEIITYSLATINEFFNSDYAISILIQSVKYTLYLGVKVFLCELK